MKLLNIFKKSSTIQNDYLATLNSIALAGTSNDAYIRERLNILDSYYYYLVCDPFSISVDMISEKIESLTPILQNKKTGEIIREHKFLDLINNPNANESASEFWRKLSCFYAITGNAMIRFIGNINFPPSEMEVLPPNMFSVYGNVRDLPASYRYQSDTISQEFNYTETGNYASYFDSLKFSELIHIRTFNPKENYSNPFGVSKANSMQLEIEQYINANIHNLSILKNSARMSGILGIEGSLTKDQRESLKDQFERLRSGARNAGKTLYAESGGGKITYSQLSQSNKDMDYTEGKRDNGASIFVRMGIPLPLVSTQNMTYNNYFEAKAGLYTDTIIPLAKTLYGHLLETLSRRYPDLKYFTLIPDEDQILVLRKQKLEELKIRNELSKYTNNEFRALLGLEPLNGEDSLTRPVQNFDINKSKFINTLKRAGFKNNEIENYTVKYFG